MPISEAWWVLSFLQVFIVLAALLFGGAGYEIYVFLKAKLGQKSMAYYHQNNSR